MNTATDFSADFVDQAFSVARRHGLHLSSLVDVNELGLDFRVITAVDHDGITWILRQPRRPDTFEKIQQEARVLALLRSHLPFAVPDWRIAENDLVAYPRLNDPTAIHVESSTGEIKWNIDKSSDAYTASLGRSLAALHGISINKAKDDGWRNNSPLEMRDRLAKEISLVTRAFKVDLALKRRWENWLRDTSKWPNFTTIVHGDLYAGHILVNSADEVTGIIDWTEAEIGDPSIDFCSHLMLFGEGGLERLIGFYREAGGAIWPEMHLHIKERLAATPLKYALFALKTEDETHMESARIQLLNNNGARISI